MTAVARKLDFGYSATLVTGTARGRAGLRLAPAAVEMAGAGKYRLLAARRRRAQIKARHVLDEPEAEPRQLALEEGMHGLRGGQ